MSSRIAEVIDRAMTDSEFAERLRDMAMQAARSGHGSPDFDDLIAEFAAGPEDLARIKARSENADLATHTTTTTTTTSTTTLSTPVCTTATITTTTTVFDLPE